MWKDAFGIETRLDKREWKYFLDSRALRGDWDAMRFAWTGDFAHPATFLDLFMSGNPMNLPGYDNSQYDQYLQSGEFTRAEALLLDEHPVIPLYFYVSKHLVSPAVHGFQPNPLDLHPSRFVSLR
jgi:ABC-type oligopeptide transport system substrate-binding subunit